MDDSAGTMDAAAVEALLTRGGNGVDEALSVAVRTAGDEAIATAVASLADRGLTETAAGRMRILGAALIRALRISAASVVYLALARAPLRCRGDLFALAHTMMGYRGLWMRTDAPPPPLGVMMMLTKLDPDDYTAWINVVRLWLDAPAAILDPTAARTAVDTALRLRPESPDARYASAMLLEHGGDVAPARRAYEAVLAVDPGHTAARFRLWRLAERGHDGAPSADLAAPAVDPEALEVAADAAGTVDLARAAGVLSDTGCVVLRGVVPRDEIGAIATDLHAWLPEGSTTAGNSAVPFADAPEPLCRRLRAALDGLSSARRVPDGLSRWSDAGWRLHGHGTWWLQWHRPEAPRPTGWHQDQPVNWDRADWFTLWMPFVACGPGVAPGLQVAASGIDQPLHLAETMGAFVNPVPVDDVDRYFRPTAVRPRFAPGDLLIFGKKTLHGTWSESGLPKPRSSFDSRFLIGPSPEGLA